MSRTLTETHHGSNRTAVYEDDGRTGWLYLTGVDGETAERECLVYSLAEKSDGHACGGSCGCGAQKDKNPLHEREAGFLWSPDGEAVALLFGGIPSAMIDASGAASYALAAGEGCPWALPWNDEVYARLFFKPC